MVIRKRVQVLLNIWLWDSEMTWVPLYPPLLTKLQKIP